MKYNEIKMLKDTRDTHFEIEKDLGEKYFKDILEVIWDHDLF